MTAQTPQDQPEAEQKVSDKELNFRALEAKYQKELAAERAAREQAERALQERSKAALHQEEEDDVDDEPYVDKKKLARQLAKFGESTMKRTQEEIQSAVNMALREERKQNWIKTNPDFYEVLQHAEKIISKDPELAETILEMPEGFERQKLVYKSIKALNLHRPEVKEPSIQEKIDSNRRSPYYQPSGVGNAPYMAAGDFSNQGKKEAYSKMQQLKARLGVS